MKAKRYFGERGQSLIMLAVIAVVLIGALAIAVDLGYVYLMRRAAQNAADAGALAGARELCMTQDPAQAVINAHNQAHNYAETVNHISNATSQVSVPTVNYDAAEVKVDVTVDYNNTIAGFFGQPSMRLGATATAGCYSPGAGTGVLPIGWRCYYQTGGSGPMFPDCEMQFMDDDNQCTLGDDHMYFFIDSQTGTIYDCQGNPNPLPGATKFLDCDYDDDGIFDIEPLSTANPDKPWFWIDINDDGSAAGTSDLSNWIVGKYNEMLNIHTWVLGITGVRASLYNLDVNKMAGLTVGLPVFDDLCNENNPQSLCPTKWHTSVDDQYLVNNKNPYFHIISFAPFRINCGDGGGGASSACAVREYLLKPDVGEGDQLEKSEKTIEGCFTNEILPGVIGRPGGGVNAGAFTLYLTR